MRKLFRQPRPTDGDPNAVDRPGAESPRVED